MVCLPLLLKGYWPLGMLCNTILGRLANLYTVQFSLFLIVQVDWTMAFTGQSKHLHILVGIFSLDILFLEGESPLLMRKLSG